MPLDTPIAMSQAHGPTTGRGEHLPAVRAEKPFSRWLDCFRWIAALAVVFAHTENRMLVRIMDVSGSQRSAPYYFVAFVAGFAHQAVMIFFVLSGYLVGGGLWKEAKKNKSIDLPIYLVKRISRLCIVLYPALLLIAGLNAIGIWTFNGLGAGIYPSGILHSMGPAALACNATFLNTALCGSYGADGALWSLFNEFWYYLVWPIALSGLLVSTPWKRAALLATACLILFGLTALQFDGSPVGPYMLIWLLGVVIVEVRRPLVPSLTLSTVLFLAGSLLVRLFVRLSYEETHPVGLFFVDLLVSVLFANLLITMKSSKSLPSPPGRDYNFALASFSFSLYCIHTPILNLYAAAMRHYTGMGWKMIPSHSSQWGAVFGAIAISVAIAFLFSRATESHTGDLRGWLMKMLRLDNAMRQPTVRFK
jgi:peptidoglycan/LPS O-acetylase OafA/YrhL